MTHKLVVIINSLKVPKIKTILLHEVKFLVPNYSCLQNPWLGGYRPQIPVLSVLNWVCWTPPPRTKFLGTPLPDAHLSFLSHTHTHTHRRRFYFAQFAIVASRYRALTSVVSFFSKCQASALTMNHELALVSIAALNNRTQFIVPRGPRGYWAIIIVMIIVFSRAYVGYRRTAAMLEGTSCTDTLRLSTRCGHVLDFATTFQN